MHWKLLCYGIFTCFTGRVGYAEFTGRCGRLRSGGRRSMGAVCQTSWQSTQCPDLGHGPSLRPAENNFGPADPLWCRPGGWQSASDTRSQRHRDDPDGVGVAGSQAGRGIGGPGPYVARSRVLLGDQGRCWGKSTSEWNATGSPDIGCTEPSPKKVKLSNVLDQTDDTEVATKTRAEMGIYYENHREITGADPLPEVEPTDLQVAASDGRQGRGEGRKPLRRLLHPDTLWEKNTTSHENEKLLLSAGWHVESGRYSGTASLSSVASLL